MSRGLLNPVLVAAGLGAFAATAPVLAADRYPERPIRMLVPFAVGGNADLLARIIGQKLGESLGQQIIIDNRAGAAGVIGTELAARAAPDGYTLLFTASGHAINPGLYTKLPFDTEKDFTAISLVGSTPLIITVNPALTAKTVKELVALAKSHPGALNHASAGNGSPGHLAGALFNSINGISILHVPYKATAQAFTDLISGQMQVMYPSATSVLPHIKAGKLRALAITGRQRSTLAPDIPTAGEAGLPGYEASIWNGILVPAGTPKPIVDQLHATIVKVVQTADAKTRIAGLGADVAVSSPEQFSEFISAELKKWNRVIKQSNIRID